MWGAASTTSVWGERGKLGPPDDSAQSFLVNEIVFPVEFTVSGVPVSLQASAKSRKRWIEKVRQTATDALPDDCFAASEKVAVVIYYFPATTSTIDVDNIIKPIVDGMRGPIYCDDNQVERVVCQRFEPDTILDFTNPSATLLAAASAERPVTFVRIHTNLKPVE